MKKSICEKCAGTGEAINQKQTSATARRALDVADILLKDVANHMKISESYLCDLHHGRRSWNPKLIAAHRKAFLALANKSKKQLCQTL